MTARDDGKDMGALASRRSVLALGGAAVVTAVGAHAHEARDIEPVPQPAAPSPAAFMRRAEQMRDRALERGDQGYGAVVVRDGRIVGLGPSRVVTDRDPTAHAEMEAIRDAARRLGTRDLAGCVLYSTSAPCAMCETAAYWGRIERMVHGADLRDGGAPRYAGC